MQHCTRKALGVLSVLAMAAWLSASARAQDYQTVAFDEGSSETAEIKAEVSELRNRLNAASSQPAYEGNGCGCGAPVMEAGCGCEASCGCDAGCGCDSCEDTCGTWGGFEPCCHCTGFWGEAEIMWFRYHRQSGVDAVPPATDDGKAEFDFEISPRITVGYVRCDGLGARIRYWEYDHNSSVSDGGSPPGFTVDSDFEVQVATYNIDLEMFDTFALNRNWDLELAFGIRYNEFTEVIREVAPGTELDGTHFSGYGGLASAEVRRCIGTNGAVFGRVRAAILMSDTDRFDNDVSDTVDELQDTVVGMTELAFGYQYTVQICGGGYYFVKGTAEWQQWSGYSQSRPGVGGSAANDVGFGGFGIAAGIAR